MSLARVATRGYLPATGGGSLATVARRGFTAFAGLPAPPAGKQYATVTSLTWIGDSLLQGLSPPPTIGCVFIVDTTVDGDTIRVNGDGTFIIYAAGDTHPHVFQADLVNPATGFDWGAWTVTVDPAVVLPPVTPPSSPPTTIGATPAVPMAPAFSFADPLVMAQIDGQIRSLYPNGWFPT